MSEDRYGNLRISKQYNFAELKGVVLPKLIEPIIEPTEEPIVEEPEEEPVIEEVTEPVKPIEPKEPEEPPIKEKPFPIGLVGSLLGGLILVGLILTLWWKRRRAQ